MFAKDLRILRRSPLLVGLLVLYPILIALLIGFAVSRGPQKPKVAIVNEVPKGQGVFQVGSEKVDTDQYAGRFASAVDPVRVSTREEALEKVRSGEALGALIIPRDIIQKLQSGGVDQASLEIFYNAENPLKKQFVESVIEAQLADANRALAAQFQEVANDYLGLLLRGGRFEALGYEFNVLGLENARRILEGAKADLPPEQRAAVDQVIRFAGLAIDNLDLSDDVLASVSEPLRADVKSLEGQGKQSLDVFGIAVAVCISMMIVCLLLAAGMLALEREENAFARLARGLISRLGLLVEKIGLATLCAALVGVIMLCGIGLFVTLDWGNAPLWVVAAAFGALGFAALGVAIGGVAREVRAASLLAILLSLPVAALGLVPSGATNTTLYDIVQVVNAAFPFKPALDAMDAALQGTPSDLWVPLVHLLALGVAFAALARVALRRFG
jgi:ABC-type multidrug transport system permease subunit